MSIGNAVRRRWWLATLVLLLVLIADGVITARSPRSYQARAEFLIGPSTTVDPGQLVYSVDALGRSMIVGTYANVLATDVVRRDALSRAGITPDDTTIAVKTAALADSAVVQVTTVASDPTVAAAVANAVGQVGEVRMGQLYPMYEITAVTLATPPTSIYRPDIIRNLSLGFLLGCLSAAAIAWTLDSLVRARRQEHA
jgi:capsular polysaccharide biosynthesis protein